MDEFRHVTGLKSVTLQEVARAAGVSPSAASVILNGARGGTRVSVSTRRKVFETATRLGYRANELARSLVTGRSNRVAVYSGKSRLDARKPFFAELLAGVLEGAYTCELDTGIHTLCRDEARLLALVRGQALDGLIIHAHPDDPILPLLGELRVPCGVIADRVEGLPSIMVDDDTGGTLLAQHLASRGHKHVLIKQPLAPPRSAFVRTAAFAEVAERLGVRVSWSVESVDGKGRLGVEDLRLLTEGTERATAIMAWCDDAAESVCQSLESFGLSIPGHVAVTGFDGLHKPYSPRYELTTIQAPWAQAGREAIHSLKTLIGGGTVPRLTTLPVLFVHGKTT